MDSQGSLVFNFNDFDEAYVGPFTWDLKRFASSIALIGYSKALSDKQIVKLVQHYAAAYRERIRGPATNSEREQGHLFTLETATGPILEALHHVRMKSRVRLLESMTEIRDYERRFTPGGGAFELDITTRKKVESAFDKYLETLPKTSQRGLTDRRVRDVVGRRGIGIGSAGLRSYNTLLEGPSEALENDIVIYMKQSIAAAVSGHISHDSAEPNRWAPGRGSFNFNPGANLLGPGLDPHDGAVCMG